MHKTAFIILLTVAILGQGSAAGADPVVVPGRYVQGVWVVEGTVSGRRALLMVDSGANRTAILPDAKLAEGDRDVEIKIGGFKAHAEAYVGTVSLHNWLAAQTEETGQTTKPVLVILGQDVLSQVALGIDYDKAEISFWKGGKLTADMATKWVSSGSTSSPSTRLQLAKRFDNRVGLPFSLGTSKGWCTLDTGAANTSLLPTFGNAAGSIVTYRASSELGLGVEEGEMRIIPQATIGDVTIPWMQYNVGSAGSDVPGKPDGIFSPRDFRSPRVLIDFPGLAAFYSAPSATASLSLALSQLINFPMYIEGDEIKLGPIRAQHPQALKPYQGKRVAGALGRPAKDILEALQGKRADALSYLKDLALLARSDYVVVLEVEGKAFRLDISVSK